MRVQNVGYCSCSQFHIFCTFLMFFFFIAPMSPSILVLLLVCEKLSRNLIPIFPCFSCLRCVQWILNPQAFLPSSIPWSSCIHWYSEYSSLEVDFTYASFFFCFLIFIFGMSCFQCFFFIKALALYSVFVMVFLITIVIIFILLIIDIF